MNTFLVVIFVGCSAGFAASAFGGESEKKFEFSPRFHSDGLTEEASYVADGRKLSVCEAYKTQLAEPKSKKAVCNVKCEIFKSIKCSLPELEIPECNDYAAYVYKRIIANFEVMKNDKDFTCEIPTSKDYKTKSKLTAHKSGSEIKTSKFCGEYKKFSKESDFEFPCYVKCDTYIVGVSIESNKPDWELTCESYQHACTLGSSNMPMNVGNICEAYRRFVLSKVKLGDTDYHHCNVYNHGPQFNYFNRTLH